VNWLFRRHFWIMHVMFLSILALIMGKTCSTLVGYWLSKKLPEKPRVLQINHSDDEPVLKNFANINERNLFGARREEISLADLGDMEESDPGRWQDAGPSSLSIKLVSTMVFFDPFDSRAILQDSSAEHGQIFSIGECQEYQKKNSQQIETVIPSEGWEPERACNNVFGVATLLRIEESRVYIFNERDRRYEYLSLLEGDKGPPRQKMAMIEGTEEEGGGVRKTGPTSYEIDQAEFDRALSNVSRLMTEARAVPELDASGANIGFKLVYLKDGSLFERIGMEKMDVLTRINGYDLNTPEKALQLFSKLRSAPQFTIDLKRGDQSITLDYSVVRQN